MYEDNSSTLSKVKGKTGTLTRALSKAAVKMKDSIKSKESSDEKVLSDVVEQQEQQQKVHHLNKKWKCNEFNRHQIFWMHLLSLLLNTLYFESNFLMNTLSTLRQFNFIKVHSIGWNDAHLTTWKILSWEKQSNRFNDNSDLTMRIRTLDYSLTHRTLSWKTTLHYQVTKASSFWYVSCIMDYPITTVDRNTLNTDLDKRKIHKFLLIQLSKSND